MITADTNYSVAVVGDQVAPLGGCAIGQMPSFAAGVSDILCGKASANRLEPTIADSAQAGSVGTDADRSMSL
jgi:hypothetical protein